MDVTPSIVNLFLKLYGEFSWRTLAIVYGYDSTFVKCRSDRSEVIISIDRVNNM